MQIIITILILNILIILILNKNNNKESLTIKTTDSDIFFLLSDDIYLTLKKEKDDSLNRDNIYKILKEYASELSKVSSKLVVLDKFNLITQEEAERIVFSKA